MQNFNRLPIINDTTRSITVESEIVEFDSGEQTIWNIVIRCPVDGIYTSGTYYESWDEAMAVVRSGEF